MAVPTFHTIAVVDIERPLRNPPQRRPDPAGQREGIVDDGLRALHGDRTAGDEFVGRR